MKKILLSIITVIAFGSITKAQNIIYVNIDATGLNNGSSWLNAYNNPQDAFNSANTNDEVWVAKGKYIRNSTNRNSSFNWTADSLKVFGGFVGTEISASQSNSLANPTIFSGDLGNDSVLNNNAYTVFQGPYGSFSTPVNYALIDGITIQDGYANNTSNVTSFRGGGFFLQDYVKHIEFNNCTFRKNYAQGGAAILLNCITLDADVLINNCVIEENTGDYAPALVSIVSGYLNLEVNNSLIVNNLTESFTASNVLGAVAYLNSNGDSDINFYNTTIANNKDSTSGDGGSKNLIFYYVGLNNGTNNLNLQNCIMYNNVNTTRTISEFSASHHPMTDIQVKSSISEVNSYDVTTSLTNVITFNPLFVDASNRDFTLQNTSPAINSGSQTGLTISSLDLAGNPRVFGAEIDMGCYENQIVTSIEEQLENRSLSIYPNPTKNQLTIGNLNTPIVNIKIVDITGKRVKTINGNTNTVNVSDLTKGIYFLQVQTENGLINSKFIKE